MNKHNVFRIILGICCCITIGYTSMICIYRSFFMKTSRASVYPEHIMDITPAADDTETTSSASDRETNRKDELLDIHSRLNESRSLSKTMSSVSLFHSTYNFRRVIKPSPINNNNEFPVVYEKCAKIPPAPIGTKWMEDKYLNEPEITNALAMADGKRSKIWIEGNNVVTVGGYVHARLQLYDGFGNPRRTGGDLVRVWIKEPSKGASSNTEVIDHQNGSYSATIKAFWVGQPQLIAAITSTRQVIAATLKRRYTCPPVVINTMVFQHPHTKSIQEQTPCNYDPQVTGYTDICNMTKTNYGSPWYCGKPRNPAITCEHFTFAASRNLWAEGIEQRHTSDLTLEILNIKHEAMLTSIPTNLKFIVKPGIGNQQLEIAEAKCNSINWKTTWSALKPGGYLYNRKWNNRHCVRDIGPYELTSCVKDTTIAIIGDSTTRQIFISIAKMLPCTLVTKPWSNGEKHTPAVCVNRKFNYKISWNPHQNPWCTKANPIRNMISVSEYLNKISGSSKTILVLNLFAHFMNYHSHVFYETLQNTKKVILDFINRNNSTTILIKGPNTLAFVKNIETLMWLPEIYVDIYAKMIHEEFKELSDRVIYLDSFDVTVSTEQQDIHPEDYIVDELSRNIFSYVCP